MTPLARMAVGRNAVDFVDDDRLARLVETTTPDASRVREIIAKSLAKEPLTVEETAALLAVEEPALVEEIFDAARRLKRDVYGNRIVLFAPLYVGNLCVNDCAYCGFRRSNPDVVRRTLAPAEIVGQVEALENMGHKRLILVFGEHPEYGPEFLAECVRAAYAVKRGRGEIRRVNINAAPLDHEGYRIVRDAGIGTFQIFQETYHHATYARLHPAGTRKGDYLWRLDALSRAMESGQGDVGIGALFGLTDWRFEVLGLVSHARFLAERFGCGPHTISFPRMRPASGVALDGLPLVTDEQFKRLVAILRLAVPYTGLILTARESARVRRDVMAFGVSQIDAGSRIELGGYTEKTEAQQVGQAFLPVIDGGQTVPTRRDAPPQFELGDVRPLDAVCRELMEDGNVPSFCTACYRLGRTGEQFMEFAIPGFIRDFCTPNALTTLEEYLVDYASTETRIAGEKLIATELAKLPADARRTALEDRLRRIRDTGERDLYF